MLVVKRNVYHPEAARGRRDGLRNTLYLFLPDGRKVRLVIAPDDGRAGSVRVGVEAPRDVVVMRGEIVRIEDL